VTELRPKKNLLDFGTWLGSTIQDEFSPFLAWRDRAFLDIITLNRITQKAVDECS